MYYEHFYGRMEQQKTLRNFWNGRYEPGISPTIIGKINKDDTRIYDEFLVILRNFVILNNVKAGR